MSAIGPERKDLSSEAAKNRLPVTGYLDRWSARPGERLAVKVSTAAEDYHAELVRVRHGDPNPAGPGVIFEPVAAGDLGRHPGRSQEIRCGSYAEVPADERWHGQRLLVRVLVQPWLLDRPAVLLAAVHDDGSGWWLEAGPEGTSLVYRAGSGEERVASGRPLPRKRWSEVIAGYDRTSGRLVIAQRPLDADLGDRYSGRRERDGLDLAALAGAAPLTMAAFRDGPETRHFSGRLEAPILYGRWPEIPAAAGAEPVGGEVLARWDFALAMESQAILDEGPHGLNGRLVNVPTRAVRGARWSGREMSWRAAPGDYAAIHFHEEDLYDCGWETDFELEVPADLPSGVYAVQLTAGEDRDHLPFHVLPPKGKRTADVCFLASTFTYQAYANHARGNADADWHARVSDWGAYPYNPDQYPIYGPSTYNYHRDGSGVAFASRLRPTLTVRAGFITFPEGGSGLRHFPADSHLVHWLDTKGIACDVVTDEDLDDEGVGLIADYKVVLTGSHPEYHTAGTLDALKAHTARGGHFIYLGGNGFYWRITRSPSLPGMIELRRGEGGIRAWAADPGEYYHQLDGAYGGLWRRSGRPPQALAGVGFSGQGLFEGSYYRRLPASYEPEFAWLFEGIGEERIGDFGFSGGGAAGFELDRADVELGTPEDTVILARSEGHGESFVVVPEELLSHLATVSGEEPEDLIRAEIVHFRTPAGGVVIATGSITFCGSLTWNGCDNDISRFLENAIRGLLKR